MVNVTNNLFYRKTKSLRMLQNIFYRMKKYIEVAKIIAYNIMQFFGFYFRIKMRQPISVSSHASKRGFRKPFFHNTQLSQFTSNIFILCPASAA